MEAKNIIIKKGRKKGHGSGHGGSWKVAYADFVTAMMAFFLLLWLITMVEPEKRARVSNYFKKFSIFEKSGESHFDTSARKDLADVMNEKTAKPSERSQPGSVREGKRLLNPEDFKEKLKKEIETRLSDVKDQVLVETFEGGVRIQMMDKDGNPMFAIGKSELTQDARRILKVITDSLKENENPVAIEGHTDAFSYPTNRYTNWELSTERASAARKEMEAYGLPQERLIRVAGFAATDPLIKDNPYDPRNRRISVLLYTQNGSPTAPPSQPTAYARPPG
ncbi:MAG: flagellar motor protein MotB [bacterium]